MLLCVYPNRDSLQSYVESANFAICILRNVNVDLNANHVYAEIKVFFFLFFYFGEL